MENKNIINKLSVFVVLILSFNSIVHLVIWKSYNWQGSYSETSDYIPYSYQFLLFPKQKNTIKAGQANEHFHFVVSQFPKRAVTASYKEINSGVVNVITESDKDVKFDISYFSFLPSSDMNEDQLLEKWNKYLTFQGYDRGSWGKIKLKNGNSRITLRLIDDRHIRADNFVYETNGDTILNIRTIQTTSGIFNGLIAISYLLTSFLFLLLLACFRCTLNFYQKIKHSPHSTSKRTT